MPRRAKAPVLSKLSRPRLFGAEPRERLFAQLDAARSQGSGACVVGPPGAGKTTLVASWLDARSGKGVWYQVDPGDADLATFFHYLGQAAQPYARRGQRPLPTLTPEYLSDLRGFGRRFFRELFARMPTGASVILDNYQEVDADNPFHEIVADAVDEVSPNGLLIVVSRADPPACYARLRANRAVRTIVWEDLRLTRDEARAVARRQRALDDRAVDELNQQCDGWAAGLILMLEQTGAPGSVVPAVSQRQAVFDYFAGTLFDRAPPALQHLLIQVALLPYVKPAWAQALSGDPQAERLLESLHRRHFFTQRRAEAEGSYQFHALFQAFLTAKARRTLVEDDYRDLLSRTAALLTEAGEQEAAFELMCESGDWDRAADLLLAEAPRMMEAGRWRTLDLAISRLPAKHLTPRPWLQYWHGSAKTLSNPKEALRILESVFETFREIGDSRGQCFSAAGALDATIWDWSAQGRSGAWIRVMSAMLPTMRRFVLPQEELRLLKSLLVPSAQVAPELPELTAVAERVLDLLPQCEDPALAAWSLIGLLDCVVINGPIALGERAVRIVEPMLRASSDFPQLTARAWHMMALFAHTACEFETAVARSGNAIRLAVMSGESGMAWICVELRGFVAASLGDLPTVEQTLQDLDDLYAPDLPGYRCLRDLLRGFAEFFRGNLDEAIRLNAKAIEDCDSAYVYFLKITFRTIKVDWLLRRRDITAAVSAIDELQALIDRISPNNWTRHVVVAQRFYLGKVRTTG